MNIIHVLDIKYPHVFNEMWINFKAKNATHFNELRFIFILPFFYQLEFLFSFSPSF